MPVSALPEAIVLARDHRAGRKTAQPFELYQAAKRAHPQDDEARTALYHHAMVEAGHLVRKQSGRPFRVCPTCGYDLEPLVSFL